MKYEETQELGTNWRYLNEFLLYVYEDMQRAYNEYLLTYFRQKDDEKTAITLLKSILSYHAAVKGLGFESWLHDQDFPEYKEDYKKIKVSDYYNIPPDLSTLDHYKLTLMFDVITWWSQAEGPFNTTNERDDPNFAL